MAQTAEYLEAEVLRSKTGLPAPVIIIFPNKININN